MGALKCASKIGFRSDECGDDAVGFEFDGVVDNECVLSDEVEETGLCLLTMHAEVSENCVILLDDVRFEYVRRRFQAGGYCIDITGEFVEEGYSRVLDIQVMECDS